MLTDFGPGVNPLQFAIIRTPKARRATAVYYSPTYIPRHQLQAAGWNASDPVFFDMCNGERPQGAIEMSWLRAQVLQGGANPQLPHIPQNQVRYIPAYVYAKMAKALSEKLTSIKTVLTEASVGVGTGVGLTGYGPERLPMQLALADNQGQRENYTVEMIVHPASTLSQFVHGSPQALLAKQMALFSNGGVEFHFAWVPLPQPNRRASSRVRSFDMLLPLDPLRLVMSREKSNTFNNGRLAALI